MRNEVDRQNNWQRRGKVYQAKTFAALKELYAPTKPGSEPKGIAKKEQQDAPTPPQNDEPLAAKTKEEVETKHNAV